MCYLVTAVIRVHSCNTCRSLCLADNIVKDDFCQSAVVRQGILFAVDRNCDVLPLLFDDLLKYNINISFTLKNKIKSQTAQIEFHKFSEKLASGVEVV